MKWTCKGHEMDEFAQSLKEKFHKSIYIFGAGQVGKNTGKSVKELGLLGGFIDNNVEQQGNVLLGCIIMSLEEYMFKISDAAIVIGVRSEEHTSELQSR